MDADRERWDERHRGAAVAEPAPPIGWDIAEKSLRRGARVLDVACGTGAVAVWCARRGMEVVALDVSPVAVAAVEALAAAHGVADRVDARVHDLDEGLPQAIGAFDLVVCQRYRDPDLVPALAAHLVDGGVACLTVLSAVGADARGRHHAPPGELADALGAMPRIAIAWQREADGLASVVARRLPA